MQQLVCELCEIQAFSRQGIIGEFQLRPHQDVEGKGEEKTFSEEIV
jgi:hypothetical protein